MATPETDTLPTEIENKSEMTADSALDESGVVSEPVETNQEDTAKVDDTEADTENDPDIKGDKPDVVAQENGDTSATDNEQEVAAAPQAAPTTIEPTPNESSPDESKEDSVEPKPSITPKKQPSPAKSASFIHDPNKITLRFLFAGRDGTHVIIDCKPNDTVGEVKGALMSVWPEDMPECTGGDRIRLICMGKGILMPDSKTLQAAEVPVFKTHPTPINVSVRPEQRQEDLKKGLVGAVSGRNAASGDALGVAGSGDGNSATGCCCVIC